MSNIIVEINWFICNWGFFDIYNNYSFDQLGSFGNGQSLGVCYENEENDKINNYITKDIEKYDDLRTILTLPKDFKGKQQEIERMNGGRVDYEMFDALKEKATYITDKNVDDGIYHICERMEWF